MRPLRYPLLNPVEIVGSSIDEEPTMPIIDGFPEDAPDQQIDLIFRMSSNQYRQLASMIDVARDIAYPDLSEFMWSMWCTRIISMSICESVQDCIETNEGVQEAIQEIINNTAITKVENFFNSVIVQPDDFVTPCQDILFAGILSVVNYIHERSVDFYEEIEVSSNILELASRMVSSVPIIGSLSANLTVSAIESSLENIAENYLSQWTVDSANEIACEIFCIVECGELSMDDIYTYYANRTSSQFEFSLIGLIELLSSVATGNYDNVVDFIAWTHFFQLSLVRISSADFVSWFAFDESLPRKYEIQIQLGYLNPSSAWSLLCDCDEPIIVDEFYFGGYPVMPDYLLVSGSLASTLNDDSPTANTDIRQQHNTNAKSTVRLIRSEVHDRVQFQAFSAGGGSGNANMRIRQYNDTDTLIDNYSVNLNNAIGEYSLSQNRAILANCAYIEVEVQQVSVAGVPLPCVVRIGRIRWNNDA